MTGSEKIMSLTFHIKAGKENMKAASPRMRNRERWTSRRRKGRRKDHALVSLSFKNRTNDKEYFHLFVSLVINNVSFRAAACVA